jgi:high affinity sulfate transporter 1
VGAAGGPLVVQAVFHERRRGIMNALAANPAPRVAWVPALGWLQRYDLRASLMPDLIAGLTLAAYMLPAALGDASLAGLPAQAGLYACMFSGLVFWALCSSRHTSVTVTSAISLLMGTTLMPIAGEDAARLSALAAATALMVAGLAFAAWLIRAGSLVNFVSETVLIGFKVGVALTLASTQLPKLFGMSSPHGSFWHCAYHFFTHLNETHWVSVLVGVAALGVLILGKIFSKNKPVALFLMIGGIIATGVLNLSSRGVATLGEIPTGLPAIGLPAIERDDLNTLLPLAMACFLLGAVETTAIGRMFALKHGGKLDANQEFLALAGANLAAGLGQGFPASGGMSQSLVNESAGAKTPLSGLISAVMILIVATFFSGSLQNLPKPVLAAIILMAVTGLVKVSAIQHLWRTDRSELLIVVAALGGVLTSGLLRGVLIGAVISMFLLIRRASRPHVAFLGRIPGARRYSDLDRHSDNQPVPGVLIFRSEGSLVYFNAEHVRDTVIAKATSTAPVPKVVVCDLSAAPHMDLAGAEMLKELATELVTIGSRLQIVEARSKVRDKLRVEGLEEVIGRIDRFTSVAEVIEHIERGDVEGAEGSVAGVEKGREGGKGGSEEAG